MLPCCVSQGKWKWEVFCVGITMGGTSGRDIGCQGC